MAKDLALIRIKADTNEYERNIKQAQKTWDSFTKGLGLNVGKLTGVAAAIGAVSTALKVAKDAFFKNEEQLDEWGRTVKSAEGLYSGFLNALNTSNISGYLRNMSNIVNAARDAYDALDALGTYNAFNQLNMGQTRVNMTEAMADYREGTGSKESVQAAANAYKKELEDRMKLEQDAYEAAVKNLAAQRGVNGDDLMKALTGSYGSYEQLKNTQMTGVGYRQVGGGMFGGGMMVETKIAANETERLGEALRQINDTELQDLQALGAAAKQTANEIAQTDRQVARILGGKSTTSGGGGGNSKNTKETYTPLADSIDAQIAKVKELQEEFNKTADQSVRGKLLNAIDEATRHLNFMQGKGLEPLSREIGGSLSEHLGIQPFDPSKVKIEGKDLEALEELANAGDAASTSWGEALNSIGGLSSALAAIEDPAVKVLGIIAEAIATVALTFAKSLKGTISPWDWIAGAAAGTATMISTIAAIKSATAGSFAEGGIVPGNSYSGDRLTANVNSGELILSASQQNVLASRLQNNNNPQNLRLTATIKGTDIQLALNNTARMQRRGTYVTTR
jgi:hypothetical protein